MKQHSGEKSPCPSFCSKATSPSGAFCLLSVVLAIVTFDFVTCASFLEFFTKWQRWLWWGWWWCSPRGAWYACWAPRLSEQPGLQCTVASTSFQQLSIVQQQQEREAQAWRRPLPRGAGFPTNAYATRQGATRLPISSYVIFVIVHTICTHNDNIWERHLDSQGTRHKTGSPSVSMSGFGN